MLIGRKQETIKIPEDVKVTYNAGIITVKGKLGELTRDLSHAGIELEIEKDKITLSYYFPRRRQRALIGTVKAHIDNMFAGTTYGYKYMLKIVYSHFPIRVSVEKKKSLVKIENLYGGRKPRYAKVLNGVKVKIDNEDVIVEGIDKEAVGQSAANMQELCRQRGKRRQSPKTFMDGLYTYSKGFQHEPSN